MFVFYPCSDCRRCEFAWGNCNAIHVRFYCGCWWVAQENDRRNCELLESMWGFRASSKPGGCRAESRECVGGFKLVKRGCQPEQRMTNFQVPMTKFHGRCYW